MDPIYVPANIYDFILHAKLFESTVHNIFIRFTNYSVFFVGLFLVFYAWLNRLTSISLCFCYKTIYNTFRA